MLQNLPKEIQPMVPGLLVVFILGIVLSTFEFMFGKYRELSLLFLVHIDVHKLHSSLPLQIVGTSGKFISCRNQHINLYWKLGDSC